MKKTASRYKNYHRYSLLVGIIIIGLLLAGGIYALWHKKPVPTTTSTTTVKQAAATSNAEAPAVNPTNPTPIANPNVPGGPTASDTTPAGSPEKPSGSFVSTYSATTSETLQSTCNTTSGASCTISFSNGQTTESLPAETATASPKEAQVASASWTWQPSAIGLTPGSWTVTATATLNGQTASTTSSIKLDITS